MITQQKRLEEIDALLLCGGLGMRLRPVVNDRPKALAEINGDPCIDILIDSLAREGLRRFILCTGYMGNLIRGHFKKRQNPSLKILFSHEKEPLGTGGAVKNAKRLVASSPLLVMNADTLFKIKWQEFFDFHMAKKACISMVLTESMGRDDVDSVRLNKKGQVSGYGKIKSAAQKLYTSAGVYLFNREVFSWMPRRKVFSLERDFFPSIIGRGLYGFVIKEKFMDIGTPERYEKARKICK
ncbi:MAG: sugar phosphate nucleotidyltransferase [Candidatus Omnitrophota bacterium]